MDTSRFPVATWARLTRQVLTETGDAMLRPVPHQGLPALRQAIADDLRDYKGMAVSPEQIVVGAVNLSFTCLAIFTVDRFGRRPLMIIGALIMAASMLVLGTTFYTHSVGIGSLICMLVYTAGFAMSWGPVCWVLLAEIFPNSIRSTVMSIAVAAQWIANFLVSWTFPMLDKNQYLTDTFNHGIAYWIYGVMGILAALFIWRLVPETKGKTLEEMESFWRKK